MTFEQLRDVLVDALACESEQVTLEAKLADDLGADSLAVVELTMALEEAAGITIADEDAAKLVTVADVMAFVNKG